MKYVATSVVTFGAGSALGLSKAQADARHASVKPIEGRKGWYETTGPVQFKRGEEFEHDGELPKSIADSMEPLAKPARQRREKDDGGKTAEQAAAEKAAAEKAAAEQAAADELAAKREALQERIAGLEASLLAAEGDEAKAAAMQTLDSARAELVDLG